MCLDVSLVYILSISSSIHPTHVLSDWPLSEISLSDLFFSAYLLCHRHWQNTHIDGIHTLAGYTLEDYLVSMFFFWITVLPAIIQDHPPTLHATPYTSITVAVVPFIQHPYLPQAPRLLVSACLSPAWSGPVNAAVLAGPRPCYSEVFKSTRGFTPSAHASLINVIDIDPVPTIHLSTRSELRYREDYLTGTT